MSLATKLQREVKANPAKAGGLAVLLLVACYFWAPLLKGWFGGADTPAPPVPTAAVTSPSGVVMASPAATAVTTPGVTPVAPAAAAYDWQKYAKQIDDDPHMRGSAERPTERDPFAKPGGLVVEVVPTEEESAAALAEAKPITPADAGLTLGSTLIGTRKKVALINGKSYTVGTRVSASQEGLQATFEIVSIEPRRVVLKRNGQKFELKIPRPLLDGVVERAPEQSPATAAATGVNAETVEQRTADEEPSDPVPNGIVN